VNWGDRRRAHPTRPLTGALGVGCWKQVRIEFLFFGNDVHLPRHKFGRSFG